MLLHENSSVRLCPTLTRTASLV